jgi:hypothetical protein
MRTVGYFLSVSLDGRQDPILIILEAESSRDAIEESRSILEDMIGFSDCWVLFRSEDDSAIIEVK